MTRGAKCVKNDNRKREKEAKNDRGKNATGRRQEKDGSRKALWDSNLSCGMVVDHLLIVVPEDVAGRLGVVTEHTHEPQGATHRHVLLGASKNLRRRL